MGRSSRRVAITMLSLMMATGATLAPPARPAVAAAEIRRPDLQMVTIRDWRIETVAGRRLLRFTTIFVNAGPGRFELRGERSSMGDDSMDIDQVIYRSDGTRFRRPTPAIAKYSGDGHDHWHVQGVVTYEAWQVADPQNARRGAKTGFCFFDTTPWRLSLPHARQSPYYQEEWCGTHASMTNRVGVSVGWGDRYPWDFAYQWIDITGLPGGRYRVRATVDIQDHYREAEELDNCAWTAIRIPPPGSGNALKVLRSGKGCGEAAVTAVDSFPGGQTFDPSRTVSIDAGIHAGWTFNSRGTRLNKLWRDLAHHRTGTASARATPPGESGQWLYLVSGPFSGYWLKQGDGVRLEP